MNKLSQRSTHLRRPHLDARKHNHGCSVTIAPLQQQISLTSYPRHSEQVLRYIKPRVLPILLTLLAIASCKYYYYY